jgi:hypothetical protein
VKTGKKKELEQQQKKSKNKMRQKKMNPKKFGKKCYKYLVVAFLTKKNKKSKSKLLAKKQFNFKKLTKEAQKKNLSTRY